MKDQDIDHKTEKVNLGSRSSRLLRSSGIVSFMTMCSRLAGLMRDVVIARFIGADAMADAWEGTAVCAQAICLPENLLKCQYIVKWALHGIVHI